MTQGHVLYLLLQEVWTTEPITPLHQVQGTPSLSCDEVSRIDLPWQVVYRIQGSVRILSPDKVKVLKDLRDPVAEICPKALPRLL